MVELLLGITGALVQALFRYFPPLETWYMKQEQKGPIMLGAVFIVSLGYFAFACVPAIAGALNITLVCSTDGLVELGKAFVSIAVGNQLLYLYGPKNVVQAQADRDAVSAARSVRG